MVPQATLSIIIPALNEADQLPALLEDLRQQKEISFEIIVGDGGSSDATPTIVEAGGARLVRARRGRGTQMNAAAEWATGEYLLFLHADSRIEDSYLLSNALRAIQLAALENPRVAGHFRLQFIRTSKHNGMAYRYIEEKTALNRAGTTNGDQGLLLSKEFFRHLGGFNESLPFLEDQRIAGKIRSQGTWLTLPGSLKTSARRFETEGFHRRYILMGMMMGLYSIGETSFFLRAPEVYRVQQETGKLFLSPFFSLIWRLICQDWGALGSIRIFYRLGRYIRQNSWQIFFWLDVGLRPLLGPGRYPCLHFYDQRIGPYTNYKILDALTGIGCFFWYMGILTSFFWLTECGARKVSHLERPHEKSD